MQKEYKTEEITIIWKPKLCQHAGVCVKMLPKVYNPKERPWCRPENATTEELMAQIDACPSKALTYKLNKPMIEIVHNIGEGGGSFLAVENGKHMGYLSYEWASPTQFAIMHTVVEKGYQGRGVAKALLDATAAFARENGHTIRPVCPYVESMFRRYPGYNDINANKSHNNS